ncbi:MAG: hypothetical protein EOP83_02825 [Verrucomicrobiaceae bacterium]|nr:MAG: hypothetical protein EOP83_02825 [Verrucomicrobiaceae bacterium]
MSYHFHPKNTYPHVFVWMPWPPDHSPLTIVASNTFLTEVREWCEVRLFTDFCSNMVNQTDFVVSFQKERDAFEFRLRWC